MNLYSGGEKASQGEEAKKAQQLHEAQFPGDKQAVIGPSSVDPPTTSALFAFSALDTSVKAAELAGRRRSANSMSALLETSLGDIVIDLLVDESPKACEK